MRTEREFGETVERDGTGAERSINDGDRSEVKLVLRLRRERREVVLLNLAKRGG